MKERVKVRIDKKVKERSSDTRASLPKPAMNSAEQINRTKPERSKKFVSFASDLMILANKAAEEDKCEQDVSQGKRELMMQPRAKSTVESHRAKKALKEARLNKGLELYKIYKRKKRANESAGLRGCTKFLRNNLSGSLQQLSFEELLVLANAAAQEYLPVRVEQDTCKQSESGETDSEGSCFGLSEELQRNQELLQQKGEAAPVKVVEEVKPNIYSSDGFRIDRLFEKKYVRRIRVKNKEQLESTSVGVVAGSSNLFNKLCGSKPSSLTNVYALEREEELVLVSNNGETQSKSEQSRCSGIKNKTKSRDETETTAAAVSVSGKKQFDCLHSAWEQGYPKRKRSQIIIRKPKERKKNLSESREGKKQACDDIDRRHNSGQEAETVEEEEDVSDTSNSSSCNLCSNFIFDVQWRKKRKRNCMKLEEAQSNLVILLIAVEAITHQLRLLDISL
ncbi:hypothetical protein CARUB_v10020287mg [Capsella rubella]|uniref:Uncharacterized protein n=1 Tax=Capsella rubella TaxID=81985 RepID=R0IEK0_9BRAS|nr:uncharacterized protein LOC17895712 [Capsella rubella]EOA35148.1 hypothetical protein CARUB_v10020287mg [Capsella rubella]